MRNPPRDPPPEPFRLLRTPPSGTLVGLSSPPAPAAAPLLPDRAAVTVGPRPLRKRLVLARDAADLEQLVEGLRGELVYAREWLPAQLEAAGLRPRRRARFSPVALAAGVALGLALGLAIAAVALGWPDVAALRARAARLSAPPTPGAQR